MTRRHIYRYSGLTPVDPLLAQLSDTWTVYTPTTAVAIGGQYDTYDQTGSRIHYIDYVSGHDGTATSGVPARGTQWSHLGTDTTIPDVYFWNGTNIIDSQGRTAPAEGAHSGLAYGTDPFQPSASVKPFKTYCYCALKGVGATAEPIGNLDNVPQNRVLATGGNTASRGTKPDWWLFKRGVQHNWGQDVIDWQALRGTVPTSTVALSLGGPASGVTLLGAWGDPTLTRPELHSPATQFYRRDPITTDHPVKNNRLVSLHFNGQDRSNIGSNTAYGFKILGDAGSTTGDVRCEDVWFDACSQQSFDANIQMYWFRCVITDSNAGGGTGGQGLYCTDGSNGFIDPATGIVRATECIFARNGYDVDPNTTWPPTSYNHLARNTYMTGRLDQTQTGVLDSIMLYGGSGDQLRCGGSFARNFFYNSGIDIGGHGQDNGVATSPAYEDNFIQIYKAEPGIADAISMPGWAYTLSSCANNVTFQRNIVSTAQVGRTENLPNGGITIQTVGADASDDIDSQLENNLITNNIFECGAATKVFNVIGGTFSGRQLAPLPALGINTFSNNICIPNQTEQFFTYKGWYGGNTPAANRTSRNASETTIAPENTSADATRLASPVNLDTSQNQNWKLVCTNATVPATFSVTGYNKAGGGAGAQADLTVGVPYANAYWSGTLNDGGLPYVLGTIITFVITQDPAPADPTVITGNTTYANVAAAGFPDPDRTMKTYFQSRGVTVTSADGYTEALTLYKTCRKGNWPKWLSATAILNYHRAGFGLSALAYP